MKVSLYHRLIYLGRALTTVVLIWCIGECMVSIVNIYNCVKNLPAGNNIVIPIKFMIFDGYVKVRVFVYQCHYLGQYHSKP